MARSPESNQAFFREVDDEVRRERMAYAARRYGVIAVIVALIALLAFGGYLLWRHRQETQAAERGEQFTAAMASLSSGNAKAAAAKLAPIAATRTKGYAPLAQVLLADMAVQQGKDADAAAAFLKVSGDAAAPQPIRDLALVRATVADFDRLTPRQVIARMQPLAGTGKPWAGTAGEMIAIAQIKLGQTVQAGQTILAVVRDPTVPQSLRERLAQIGGDLGIDAAPALAARPAADVRP